MKVLPDAVAATTSRSLPYKSPASTASCCAGIKVSTPQTSTNSRGSGRFSMRSVATCSCASRQSNIVFLVSKDSGWRIASTMSRSRYSSRSSSIWSCVRFPSRLMCASSRRSSRFAQSRQTNSVPQRILVCSFSGIILSSNRQVRQRETFSHLMFMPRRKS